MSKKDEKKRKLNNFKNKAKKMSAQKSIPKTHLIPETSWKSTDILDMRGDLFEGLEKTLIAAFEQLEKARQDLSKCGKFLQMIASSNIENGKVVLSYKWNNGEPATAEEVTDYETKAADLQKAQRAQYEAYVEQLKQQEQGQSDVAQKNAAVTGLVDADGNGIGSDIPLDDDNSEEYPEGEEA